MIISLAEIQNTCKYLEFPTELTTYFTDLFYYVDTYDYITEQILDTKWAYLKNSASCNLEIFSTEDKDGIAALIVLLCIPDMRATHKEKDIPKQITKDTAADFLLWLQDHEKNEGMWGLSKLNWLHNHITGRLYTLGRLQFKPSTWNGDTIGNLHQGNKIIEVHIPATGKLEPIQCLESFSQAKEFISKYYPEYKETPFHIESWLLDPKLQSILPSDSNIVKFQKLWNLHPSKENDKQANERVFGIHPIPHGFKAQNSLQQKMLECIEKGTPITSGIGIRDQ